MSKLSIITINYNNKVGLEKTIKSVVEQSFSDFEFIVIDGGSTDGSSDIVEKYKHKITYSVSERDKGIYDAQNKGIGVAKGEYCLFLNSGDYLLNTDVLQKVVENNLSSDIIACDMQFDYGEKKIVRQQPDSVSFFYMMDTSIWHPATFIKRTLFQKFGNYNLAYKTAADYDFFLKTVIVNNATYAHQHTVLSVFDTGGVSSDAATVDKRKEERRLIQKQYFPDQMIKEANQHNKNNKRIYTIIKTVYNSLLGIKRFFYK